MVIKVNSVSMTWVKENLDHINLIDIRPVIKYNNGHIPNSKNIPHELLLSNPTKYLNKDNSYFLYCQKGITSIKVTNVLSRQGYKVASVEGGYERYILMN